MAPVWGWLVDRRIRDLLRHSQFHPTHRYGRGPVLSTGRVQPATLRYHPANDGQRESWWKQLTRHHAKQHRPNRHEHKQPSRFVGHCLSKSKRHGHRRRLAAGAVSAESARKQPSRFRGDRLSKSKHHGHQHRLAAGTVPAESARKQPSRFRSDCLSKSKCHGQQYRLAAASVPPQCTHQQRKLVANILAHARTRNRVNEAQPCAYISRVEQVGASAQKRNSEDSDPKRDLPTHSWPFRG